MTLMPHLGGGNVLHFFTPAVSANILGSNEFQSRLRLAWVLSHHPGPLILELVDYDGGASNAVSVTDDLYGRRVILDPELADAFRFSQEALEVLCGADKTIVGLTLFFLVQAEVLKVYKVDERLAWEILSDDMVGDGN